MTEYFERSGVFQLVWGRDYRQQNAEAFAELVGARVLINGHEPCYEGFAAPNDLQIILDCCGEKAGYLMLPIDRELSSRRNNGAGAEAGIGDRDQRSGARD